ncbi:MAG: complex I NDUFA9 subunit family protein [Chloroflexi bacterium]|nr:complex I NDUFA9 subunit family protein [Chloroflexota bacterium]
MILITGATGYVGRHLVPALQRARVGPLRCLAHASAKSASLQQSAVEWVHGDVGDPDSLRRAMQGVTTVVHLVAVIRERPPAVTFQTVNVDGARNVVEAAKAAGVAHFVHMSTIGAQDNPAYPYLRSRWLAEHAVVRSGLPYTILRASILFGEGDEFFPLLAAPVKALPVVPIAGDGKARFQPLAVDDLARCLAKVVSQAGPQGKVLELGGPEQFTYEGLVDLVGETLGVRRWKVHVLLPLMRAAAWVMEHTQPYPPVTLQQLKVLPVDNVTALDSVQAQFGFVPRSPRGNINHIRQVSRADAWLTLLGSMPRRLRHR